MTEQKHEWSDNHMCKPCGKNKRESGGFCIVALKEKAHIRVKAQILRLHG